MKTFKTLILFLIFNGSLWMTSLPGVLMGIRAEGIWLEINPLAGGTFNGDIDATFEECINTFLSNVPELPHKKYVFECYEVVGYHFQLRYTDEFGEVQTRERQMGTWTEIGVGVDEFEYVEEIVKPVDPEGDYGIGYEPEEDEPTAIIYNRYWVFTIGGFAQCGEPDMVVEAEKPRLEVGESTPVTIQLSCGADPMYEEEVTLELEGVGELAQSSIRLDESGTGHTVYRATERGRAKITAKNTVCEIWESKGYDSFEVSADTSVIVGPPGIAVDLSYTCYSVGTYILTNHLVLYPEIHGTEVTGTGTVDTSIEFSYEFEECHSENFSYSGFDECSISGTFIDNTYTFTIDLEGAISYEHVCDFGPQGEVRVPIESPCMWRAFFAEPVVLTTDHGDTFSRQGGFPGGIEYSISAYWEGNEPHAETE